MQFTLFSADCIGKAANCSYPHKVLVDDAMTMEGAVAHDHVCATYKNNYRNIANFQMSDVVPMDIDNDHSDNPADWITEDKMDELFGSIDYVLVPSRHHMLPKDGKSARPRYLAGEPAYSIAKGLADKGIKGQSGVPMDDSTIKNILSSISYTGTMILQKNFFTEGHKRKKNKGELPMYVVEEMFEPLVSEADFEYAQQIMKERAESMPNRNPKLTAFSGIVKCANCGCSISRRTSKYGKKWICNTKERKGKSICDFRDIYETELEDAATKALNLNGFDADAVKSKVELITIDNAYIIFKLKNGTSKQVLREYKKGYSGFSSRLFCGYCGGMLEADYWKMGPAGQKKKYKVWVCRECSAPREFDTTFRTAAQAFFHEEKCDGLFAQNIEKAINYDDRIDFYYKEGKVTTWQKE